MKYFLIVIMFFPISCVQHKPELKVSFDIPDYIIRLSDKHDIKILDESDIFFENLVQVNSLWLGSPTGPSLFNVLDSKSISVVNVDNDPDIPPGIFDRLRGRVFNNEDPIFAVQAYAFYPINELQSWGFEVFLCDRKNKFYYVINYINGNECQVSSRTSVLISSNVVPEKMNYIIRVKHN